MAKYELSEEQRTNLMKLLARVDIKGQEAPEFLQIVEVFNHPVEEKLPEKKKE